MDTTTTDNALVPTAHTTNLYPSPVSGIHFTPIGLDLSQAGEVSAGDYNTLFAAVTSVNRASHWLLGDTLELADRTWGNRSTGSKYEEASKETGLSISTLKQIVSVCHQIPYHQRHAGLSFSHHLEACFKTATAEERERVLHLAEKEHTTVRDLRKSLTSRQAERNKDGNSDADPVRDLPADYCEGSDLNQWSFPCALEFARIADWAEHTDMMKVNDTDRENLLKCAVPMLCRLYRLLQIEMDENPDAEFNLPFDVKPLD